VGSVFVGPCFKKYGFPLLALIARVGRQGVELGVHFHSDKCDVGLLIGPSPCIVSEIGGCPFCPQKGGARDR
jgi:hypothetical protein